MAAMPDARSVIEIFRNSSGLTLAKGVPSLFNRRTILRATGEIRSFSLFDDRFDREVMIDGFDARFGCLRQRRVFCCPGIADPIEVS